MITENIPLDDVILMECRGCLHSFILPTGLISKSRVMLKPDLRQELVINSVLSPVGGSREIVALIKSAHFHVHDIQFLFGTNGNPLAL